MQNMNGSIKGIAMVETLIALPVILLLGMGVIHLGLVYQAKSNLEYASLMAARVGSTTCIDLEAMRREVQLRMRASDTFIDGNDLDGITIEILNPDNDVFTDWGEPVSDFAGCDAAAGGLEIPNDNLMNRPTQRETASNLNIQDANILRIKVTYRYDTRVPFMQAFYLDGRAEEDVPSGVDLVAYSTVRMQSPARKNSANQDAFAN